MKNRHNLRNELGRFKPNPNTVKKEFTDKDLMAAYAAGIHAKGSCMSVRQQAELYIDSLKRARKC